VKLMLTGATGQVGSELCRSLAPMGEVIATDRTQCDLSRPDEARRALASIKPDAIVNAAAYTAVDKAEQEEALATTVNATAVGALAEEARKLGALMIHYSTDYVFDGEKLGTYDENDKPNPLSAYGRSKLAGERALAQCGGDYLILRTSWVYAARRRNFLRTVLRRAGEGAELRMVDDQIGAPTWARDIADATARILVKADKDRGRGSFASDLLHLTAGGETSWCGFAQAIVTEAAARPGGLTRTPAIHPIASADYATAAVRPKNSRLSGAWLLARFGIALPDWRQSLHACMQDPALAGEI
jgi:dTDP-4-dehydrorhamnose reductase